MSPSLACSSPKAKRKPSLLQIPFGKRKAANTLETSPFPDDSTVDIPSVEELEAQHDVLGKRV